VLALALIGTACAGDNPVAPNNDGGTDNGGIANGETGRLVRASRSRPLAARVGTVLSDRPTVRVSDEAGQPLAGVTVHFRVVNGGGQLTDAVVTTDAHGLARLGRWTLGGAPGANVLRARVDRTELVDSIDFEADAVTHPAGTLGPRIDLPGGPFSVAFSRKGLAMVTRHYVDLLSAIDLESNTVIGSIATGRDPVEVAFDWDGNNAFVTHQFNQNVGVSVVTLGGRPDEGTWASSTATSAIAVGGDPWRIKPNPDYSRLFVTSNVGIITEIDPTKKKAVASYNYGVPVNGVAFHPNDTLVYFTAKTAGKLFELNRWTGDSRELTIGGFPQEVVLSPDASEMYVADETGNALHVRNTATGAAIATVPVGGPAFGVAMSPDSAQLYVTLSQAGKVVVVDRAARSVVKTIETGGVPRRVAFNRFGTLAIIPNESGWIDIVR